MPTADEPIRFAVIGLGDLARNAVLPAFKRAPNARLTALVSGDIDKLADLGSRYGVSPDHRFLYDELDQLFAAEIADAVYLALPNHLHCEYTLRCARARLHVLCEKPLAATADQCRQMVQTAQDQEVFLMTAYRLHFEPANRTALQIAGDGELGDLRLFSSTFFRPVAPGDIRLLPLSKGGGPTFDLGIYCINAARSLFNEEPLEVMAFSERRPDDSRFDDVPEMTGAVLRFSRGRLAQFLTGFGAYPSSRYHLVGTKGELILEPAYGFDEPLSIRVQTNHQGRSETLRKTDQFAPELVYFSRCIATGKLPQPDGYEGWIDVQIIEAIHRSARIGEAVTLDLVKRPPRPQPAEIITTDGAEDDTSVPPLRHGPGQ